MANEPKMHWEATYLVENDLPIESEPSYETKYEFDSVNPDSAYLDAIKYMRELRGKIKIKEFRRISLESLSSEKYCGRTSLITKVNIEEMARVQGEHSFLE